MKTDLHYLLMDPANNRTILIETPLPTEFHPAAAAKLMTIEPSAEQAGFLSYKGGREIALRMAGGEFCGNASMSAAVYCGIKTGLTRGIITVNASGTPDPVPVEITACPGGSWQGIVTMPRPDRIENLLLPGGQTCPVISFPGISHVMIERKIAKKTAESLVRDWCRFLNADALGLMFLDLPAGRLTPLVYVPGADTLFWESSCASGTAAAGAWLASASRRPLTMSLRQPGGVLEITASPDGTLLLKGTVRLIYEKTVSIEVPDTET